MGAGLSAAALGLGTAAALIGSRARDDDKAVPGQSFKVDGRKVHAKISGAGPDVILIHGASGNLFDMTFDLSQKLATNHRVIAFDRPGMGLSERLNDRGESPREQAMHLAKAADMIGVRKAVIVGHSYGGAVALAWGLERPDQAAGLVSLAGAAMPWPGPLSSWYAIAGSGIGDHLLVPILSRLVPDSYVESAAKGVFAPNPVPDGYADHIRPDLVLAADSIVANARQVGSLKPHLREMSPLYNTLSMPIEILHGKADTTVPAKIHSEPLSQIAPNANLTLLDGIGHMPHHAALEETVKTIERAVARASITS
ncbi:MAG: alpha/beta hydrolase [Rhodobacteraceae bacterium]|nr:alpha/beta hydrolase [Paracoccaceae bacterium]